MKVYNKYKGFNTKFCSNECHVLWVKIYRQQRLLESPTKSLFSLASEKCSYQLRAFIFVYSTCNCGFWMGYFLVQPTET
jgi:hypothetical protein